MLLDRRTGRVEHRTIRELPELLSAGDLVVVNRSRVLPARLLGRRAGGASAEVFLLRQIETTGARTSIWEALVRPGRRLRPGAVVEIADGFSARIESGAASGDGRRRVSLEVLSGTVSAAIDRHGRIPLPPYIRREAGPADRERYQTVFARETGSVAAPTAGLHFSESLLALLRERGVERAEVVLHVGPATFQPVKVERVEEHRVAAEPFTLPPETAQALNRARSTGGRVVAVGTTVVRTLEEAAHDDGTVDAREGDTGLVVVPGFRFRVVDALLTNFHLPRSSLLLLVCAFAGRQNVLRAYAVAIRAGYRFYSYGDAMLIL